MQLWRNWRNSLQPLAQFKTRSRPSCCRQQQKQDNNITYGDVGATYPMEARPVQPRGPIKKRSITTRKYFGTAKIGMNDV